MKFLIDAQLPRKLAHYLVSQGFDALHTLDLPNGNASTDNEINEISLRDNRIVISKDVDFYDRFWQKLEPYKLIYLTTGNIPTKKLIEIFENNLSVIIENISFYSVIEINRRSIVIID